MQHSPPIRITLVVTTVGRPRDLDALFKSVERQVRAPDEIIVVDQSAGAEITECIAAHSDRIPGVIQIRIPRCGASAGRNVGLRRATGDVVGFPDDDCELPPELVGQVVTAFSAQPDLAVLTVNTRSAEGGQSMSRTDQTGGPTTLHNLLGRCIEFSIFGRRAVLQALEFDESLGVGAPGPWNADEGPDLLARALGDGNRLIHVPEFFIVHPNKEDSGTIGTVWKRSVAYGRGRGRLLRCYPFPASVVASNLLRPAAGCLVSLAMRRVRRAARRAGFLAGTCVGLVAFSSRSKKGRPARQASTVGP